MMQPPPMNQPHMQNPAMPMPQHWAMMAPQYPQGQSQTMWSQQSSQILPPVQVAQPQQHQLPPQNFSHYAPQAGGMTPGTMQQHLAQQSQASSDEIRALWIGDLQYWMDENYIFSCFAQTGEVLSVKIIRNKHTQQSEGYGFIEFASRSMAQQVLQTYNGQMMPNIEQAFKLNWASLGSGERRGGDDGADYTIFVGDLAPEVTDYMLQETFKSCYPSVKGAKIVTDRATGRSKGYGFVKFGDLNEQSHAMTEMNGVLCSSRPMRIGPASNKNNGGIQQQNPTKAVAAASSASSSSYQTQTQTQTQTQQGTPDSENDPNNTTIFVGGLDSTVTEDMLRQAFGPYGELIHVKIPVGKRCGFVQYSNRGNAEEALRALNGTPMGGQNIRLSWGRTPLFKLGQQQQQQQQEQSSQWNGNYYAGGYSQGYGGAFGYAAAAPQQDPNLYAYASYQGGYPNFHQQQPNQQ